MTQTSAAKALTTTLNQAAPFLAGFKPGDILSGSTILRYEGGVVVAVKR